jgi:hypothetical protein
MISDVLKTLGFKHFPLTSFRLNNISIEYVFDLSSITAVAGSQPYDLKTDIKRF